ncbi:hypothetical protein B0H10DRAFT_2062135 [Mycena sp. CBHHK59/15]|nr:hypothetical protein B0H10DRAFT_2062135 [Mycena sp. CBHHK59/15]
MTSEFIPARFLFSFLLASSSPQVTFCEGANGAISPFKLFSPNNVSESVSTMTLLFTTLKLLPGLTVIIGALYKNQDNSES